MTTYRTDFTLAAYVEVDSANEYLQSDDMTGFLINDLNDLKENVVSIVWKINDRYETNDNGTITLKTNRDLTEDELNRISMWVRGQNSDGIGEGFEQNFGETFPAEDDFDEDWFEMASFDWKTNSYKFRKISC